MPARFSGEAARLTMTGAVATFTGGSTALEAEEVRLDRLQRGLAYFGDGPATAQMQLLWQRNCEATEAALASLQQQVTDNSNLLAQIQAALNLAQAANENANAVNDRTSLADSYVDPARPITAANDGTITITDHSRVYGEGSKVSVAGGSLSGFASGGYVTVYYKDAAREGGAVTYQGTTDAVAQKDDTHIVGQVTIPAAGEPPATGSGTSAPGYTPSGKKTEIYIEP